jgi:hypothetical protein
LRDPVHLFVLKSQGKKNRHVIHVPAFSVVFAAQAAITNSGSSISYLRISWPITPPTAAPPTVPRALPFVNAAPPTAPMPAPIAVFLSWVVMPLQAPRLAANAIIAQVLIMFIMVSS